MKDPLIDLSHWNPEPDWNALSAEGVVGVFLKATQGTQYIDPTWQQRTANAAAAGILPVPYHFLDPGDPETQMRHFLEVTAPPPGARLVLDHEPASDGTVPTLDDLVTAVAALWTQRPDVEITVYSGHLIKEQLGPDGFDPGLTDTSLWIAQYTTADQPDWPQRQWPLWSVWQYTDCAQYDAIDAPVDANRWNGSLSALEQFMAPDLFAPPQQQMVRIDVSTPQGIDVVVTINGEPWD